MTLSHHYLIQKAKERICQELAERSREKKRYDWSKRARPNQRLPKGLWHTWLIMAGRGFGKTRTGAESIRHWATQGPYRRIALVAHTEQDGREVMIEGESGLLAVHPPEERPIFEPSKGRLRWSSGACATLYSAENYERLRGPQFDCAWIDELAKFRKAEKLWEQIHFSLRLGPMPKTIITTTPRPIPLLQKLLADEGKGVVVTRGKTFENQENLSPAFLKMIQEKYGQTRLGLQELEGVLLTSLEGALWTDRLLDQQRCLLSEISRPFRRVVVAIDPAVTAHNKSDETGIIVAARTDDQKAYVLEDLSGRYPPTTWAKIAVEAYKRWQADRVVAEVNKGGDLVEKLLQAVHPDLPYTGIHASRGKITRAEPVAALYEQGKVFHVGKGFVELEAQMCQYTPLVQERGGTSPDRLDALVWALTDLMLTDQQACLPRLWMC